MISADLTLGSSPCNIEINLTGVVLRRFLASPYLLLLVPPLTWAGNAVIARGVVGDIVPPLALSFWRWALAGLILLPFGWRGLRGKGELIRARMPLFLLLAGSSVGLYNTLLYLALVETTAINVVLVASALPVLILLLDWGLGKAPRPLEGAGMLVSFAGLLLVVAHGDLAVLAGLHFGRGDLLVLAAALSWAAYSVTIKRKPVDLSPVALLTLLILLGTPMILPFYLWELALGAHIEATPKAAAAILYVAFLPSVAAYICWNIGVARLGPAMAGQFTYLTPPLASILAVLFLGETFHVYHAAGMGLIFGGIFLAGGLAVKGKGPLSSPDKNDSRGT